MVVSMWTTSARSAGSRRGVSTTRWRGERRLSSTGSLDREVRRCRKWLLQTLITYGRVEEGRGQILPKLIDW